MRERTPRVTPDIRSHITVTAQSFRDGAIIPGWRNHSAQTFRDGAIIPRWRRNVVWSIKTAAVTTAHSRNVVYVGCFVGAAGTAAATLRSVVSATRTAAKAVAMRRDVVWAISVAIMATFAFRSVGIVVGFATGAHDTCRRTGEGQWPRTNRRESYHVPNDAVWELERRRSRQIQVDQLPC
jgi:hypothetical protein